MVKKTFIFLLILGGLLLWGGCSGGKGNETVPAQTGDISREETADYSFLQETEEIPVDNRLDDLHAVLNLPVKEPELLAGEMQGGLVTCILGERGAVIVKNHLYADYRKSWSGVTGYTRTGEDFAQRLDGISDKEGTAIYALGPISGEKGFVAYDLVRERPSEEEEAVITGYVLYKLDENFQKVSEVHTQINAPKVVNSMAGDSKGNFHLILQEGDTDSRYVILDRDGKLLFERYFEFETFADLRTFGGGRVAMCGPEMAGLLTLRREGDYKFYEADPETGKLEELAACKEDTLREKMEENITYAVPIDEYCLAWCDKNGVIFGDSRSGEIKTVYKWSSHGIRNPLIRKMTVLQDGTVQIVYNLLRENGTYYLQLEPTPEKEEILSITIAVSDKNKDKYSKVAASFNKQYPCYHIDIRDDYEETALLTELGSGNGPVLVDTELTGFEELESLWQPLDGFLDAAGITEMLLPKAKDLGKIGDTTYGVVTEFGIDALLVADETLTDWDYDGFLKILEERPGASAFIYEFWDSYVDCREEYFDLLKNGLEDNYYLDSSTGETIFGTEAFDRVLKLSEQAKKCPPWDEAAPLKKGTAVAERQTFLADAQVIRLRRRMERKGEHLIGYPTRSGAKYLLVADSPLTLRSTASEEEKKIAYTFMRVLLSREAMNTYSVGFPIRKDVWQDRLDSYAETAESLKLTEGYDPNYMPDLEETDIQFLEEILENAVPQKKFPTALENIFAEELDAYLSGGIDGKVLSERLKSRVWLYLEEGK